MRRRRGDTRRRAVMAKRIKVEGLEALLKQFEQLPGEILTEANAAAIDSMGIALSSVQMTNRFNDAGRANASKGNKAHPPGYLRSVFKLFKIDVIRRGKLRAWATVGVPHGAGAAYYMPLHLGHKVVSHGKVTDATVQGREFYEDAWTLAAPAAERKIVAAINRVLAKYPPETPK